MNIKAVIFDLDGTLLDTIDDLTDSMNLVLRENQYPEHDREKYNYFVGNGGRKLVERALPESERNEKSIDTCLKRWKEIYEVSSTIKTKLYPGIENMLLKLKELRIPIAILSNKPHEEVLKLVSHYFDERQFVHISGQKEHIPHKPAPDGVYIILDQLNVSPESCLFVGDTPVDMKTADATGMKSVGVSWGFRPVQELKENGADYIIEDPDQLLPLL